MRPVELAAKNGTRQSVAKQEIAATKRLLVVLGDPGLGKSWLIRTETHRLCQQALAAVERGDDIGGLADPLPVRCDQLVAAMGEPWPRRQLGTWRASGWCRHGPARSACADRCWRNHAAAGRARRAC